MTPGIGRTDAANTETRDVTRNDESADLPPKCDGCDETRHIELPDGRIARCPTCHPAGRLGRCPEAGCAFRFADGRDRPCPMHADLYRKIRRPA